MPYEFIDIMRAPDSAVGATDDSPFRFEEKACGPCCDVKFSYEIGKGAAKVIVYPSGSPVKYLKLRFRGDLSFVESVYSESWERVGTGAHAEWRSVMPYRPLPWFCYLKGDGRYGCYGVKTGPDCLPFWQVDTRGVTLFLNLCSGNVGTDLSEPMVACEVVQYFSEPGADAYTVAKRFSRMMCDNPVLPREPIFGVNNWYWAYGRISFDSVMGETEHLLKMCKGAVNRPYMIVDDGWQYNRTYTEGAYIGGPWEMPNSRFSSMASLADEIHAKGAKCGLWFRPLLTMGEVPDEARLAKAQNGGLILDPSHPYTLERVRRDAERIRSWGYDLIKHDFTTIDLLGVNPFSPENHVFNFMKTAGGRMRNNTKTTATVIKELYKAIQDGAGDADVIGCNTVGHLTAGIHSSYRTGNDTSGRSFELTHRNGVNSVMRLPQNDTFYRVDPDCAAFTDKVDAELNLDYLEMCAVTRMTTLASVTPDILTEKEMERINSIFLLADKDEMRLGIKNYERTASPEIFVSADGATVREYDWESAYDGSRSVYTWMQ
ncbi:MAG: alpha-galactosidase [Clostridia bacterium]|nr:alpha-galactosidase [Clostridia bacterium]